MNGSQIAVGICKCRVNLNGTSVTLQGSLNILHLLQSVSHVRVGIGKGRTNSKRENKDLHLVQKPLPPCNVSLLLLKAILTQAKCATGQTFKNVKEKKLDSEDLTE